MKQPLWVGLFYIAAATFALPAHGATLLEKVLKFAGISSNPAQMRSSKGVEGGAIWVTDGQLRNPHLLADGATFGWPIFAPGDMAILALRGDMLVRIPLHGGAAEELRAVSGVEKLVGIDGDGRILVVIAGDAHQPLAVLSIRDGSLEFLPYDPKSTQDRLIVAYARGDDRRYGATHLFVQPAVKEGIAGKTEWSDVFIMRGGGVEQNVSQCDGSNCGQPSLSAGADRVVFVKTSPSQ